MRIPGVALSTFLPVVVFSQSPLQKTCKGWNFRTDDAELVQALLQPFSKVTVIYDHLHQIRYKQIGNTAWPWPYPGSHGGSVKRVAGRRDPGACLDVRLTLQLRWCQSATFCGAYSVSPLW